MSFNDNVKTQAYHRQNKRCGMCGEKIEGDYDFHHILRKTDGGKDTLDNCVMLCHDCHYYDVHRGGTRKEFSIDMDELRYFNG